MPLNGDFSSQCNICAIPCMNIFQPRGMPLLLLTHRNYAKIDQCRYDEKD